MKTFLKQIWGGRGEKEMMCCPENYHHGKVIHMSVVCPICFLQNLLAGKHLLSQHFKRKRNQYEHTGSLVLESQFKHSAWKWSVLSFNMTKGSRGPTTVFLPVPPVILNCVQTERETQSNSDFQLMLKYAGKCVF